MRHRSSNPASQSRKGVVLLAVLVVVTLLTLAAYQFSSLMIAELDAADSYRRSVQAKALADSGVHYTAALLSNPETLANTLGSNPYSNPQYFQKIIVHPHDVLRFQGCFTVLSLVDPDDPYAGGQPYRFGVNDECGRLNLNALMLLDRSGEILHDALMMLPNMTEEIADAIVDWIDADEEPSPNGAENEYYQALNPPYRAKNGPLDTLDELLLVKGVTPDLLFGNDRNRNGILDPDETGGSEQVNRGWSAYLTVYSREQNVNAQGQPRIYINDQDLETLYTKLSTAVGEELATYILAYRTYGPASTQSSTGAPGGTGGMRSSLDYLPPAGLSMLFAQMSRPSGPSGPTRPGPTQMPTPSPVPVMVPITGSTGAGTGGAPGAGIAPISAGRGQLRRNSINTRQGQPRRISSLFDLVNSYVDIPASDPQQPATRYPSPLNDTSALRELLPKLLDQVTTTRDAEIPARVNINTAARAVLLTLPGLSEADVQAILDHRPNPLDTEPPDEIYQTPAWLVTEANLPPQTVRTIERYVTARSQVYRVQVLGYFEGGGPSSRVEAVLDTNNGRPRIIYWRDLTELGKGFELPTGQ